MQSTTAPSANGLPDVDSPSITTTAAPIHALRHQDYANGLPDVVSPSITATAAPSMPSAITDSAMVYGN